MKNASRIRRWSGYVVIAILFAVACAFLSNWQFTRNEQRAHANGLIANNYHAAPVPLDELVEGTSGFDPEDEWRPVELTGEYLADEQLLARNRAHGNTNAYESLVPFQLDDGRIMLVDRGWVEPGYEADRPDAVPAVPTGELTVVARLRPSEPLPRSGRSAPEGQVPTIHVPSIAEMLGDEAISNVYGLMDSEDPAAAERPHAIDEPEQDPGPHLSYAVQWILFAVMGFVFIGYMIRTEIRAGREEADDPDEDDDLDDLEALEKAPRPAKRRRAKQRDRDMEEEDALLDAQS
ncbi:MAG TPA: SURF1 family protein [Microbacterium sp.]|nr:SURF1 family protein [Microbacterium sp.]